MVIQEIVQRFLLSKARVICHCLSVQRDSTPKNAFLYYPSSLEKTKLSRNQFNLKSQEGLYDDSHYKICRFSTKLQVFFDKAPWVSAFNRASSEFLHNVNEEVPDFEITFCSVLLRKVGYISRSSCCPFAFQTNIFKNLAFYISRRV